MKVGIVSYEKELILPILKEKGFVIDNRNPDIVIALGGDGTFLYAEEKYPLKPKVFIYHSHTCESCSINKFSPIIEKLDKLKMTDLTRLEAFIGKKRILAINDINIHYDPPRALRFNVKVNGHLVAENVIGDGVVISTPFGSDAYFRSITRRNFKKGIGIAFNNPTRKMNPIIVPENKEIRIEILRENGVVAHDTSGDVIKIKKGDAITVRRCDGCAKAVIFKKGGFLK